MTKKNNKKIKKHKKMKKKKLKRFIKTEKLKLRRTGNNVYGVDLTGLWIAFNERTKEPYNKFNPQTGAKYIWDEKELEILFREAKAYQEAIEDSKQSIKEYEIREVLKRITQDEIRKMIREEINEFLEWEAWDLKNLGVDNENKIKNLLRKIFFINFLKKQLKKSRSAT